MSNQTKTFFAEQEVLWTRALDTWIQLFEVLVSLHLFGGAFDTEPYFADPFEQGIVLRYAVGVKFRRTALNRAQIFLQFSGGCNVTTFIGNPGIDPAV